MTVTTVVLLAGLWAVVLVPGAWRDHRRSPRSTVDGFHEAMARLATCDSRTIVVPSGGRRVLVHPRPSARRLVLARRRAVLLRGAGLTAVTTLAALVVGGALVWTFATLAWLGMVAYLAALRSLAVQRQRARQVVSLDRARRAPARTQRPVTSARAQGAVAEPAQDDADEYAGSLFAMAAGQR